MWRARIETCSKCKTSCETGTKFRIGFGKRKKTSAFPLKRKKVPLASAVNAWELWNGPVLWDFLRGRGATICTSRGFGRPFGGALSHLVGAKERDGSHSNLWACGCDQDEELHDTFSECEARLIVL